MVLKVRFDKPLGFFSDGLQVGNEYYHWSEMSKFELVLVFINVDGTSKVVFVPYTVMYRYR